MSVQAIRLCKQGDACVHGVCVHEWCVAGRAALVVEAGGVLLEVGEGIGAVADLARNQLRLLLQRGAHR